MIGPSRVGKTSLVQAGLLPRLKRTSERPTTAGEKRWRVLPPFPPGQDPPVAAGQDALAALDRFLAAHLAGAEPQATAEALGQADVGPTARAAAWAQAHLGQCLLLAIDADALLFSRTEPEERVRFWAQLAAAAQQDTLHLVLTVRSDRWYVGDAADGDANAPVLPSADCYPLASMERDALRQVIEQPAAQQGFSFAPAGALVDGLLDAVEHQPAALPLLNETLLRMVRQYIDRMQRRRLPDDNTLTAEDNLALGGVNGVVADLANTYYEGLPADDRQAMQHVLLRLVDVNDSNQIVLRDPVEQAEFHYADPLATARAAAVIAGLAEQGLVVISADAEGPRCVQLGHSALIDTWSELRGWLVDSSQQWGLQRDLRGQVGRWLADNKEKTKLWHADPKLPQVEETLWPAGRRREGLQERLRWEKRIVPRRKKRPRRMPG
ncbi:MAG: hypothetical protein IPM84_19665 [Anaerolineae bacterium]|nr:hypothetical protein [Anaerolineae bacterium]